MKKFKEESIEEFEYTSAEELVCPYCGTKTNLHQSPELFKELNND